MTTEQVWVGAACAAATALALAALVVALRARRHARRLESVVDALVARVGTTDRPPVADPQTVPAVDATAYVITGLDTPEVEAPPARPVDGRLFADIVARETVVKAASWTHGLRRALSPASRNRIRFEMRQETRRAGRERRAETKQALREFRARERAASGAVRDVGEDVA